MALSGLVEVHVPGWDPIMLGGIEFKDKTDTKRVKTGNSFNTVDYIRGDRDIDFTYTDPKDQPILFQIYEKCVNDGLVFTQVVIDPKTNTPVARADGCTITQCDRTIKAKDEWKINAQGFAKYLEHINFQMPNYIKGES